MILQKPDQKDVIKYPCRVEIYRGDKKLETLPSTEKIVEKEKKSEKVGKEKRVQKGEFREGEQKKAEQALAEYSKDGVTFRVEGEEDDRNEAGPEAQHPVRPHGTQMISKYNHTSHVLPPEQAAQTTGGCGSSPLPPPLPSPPHR